MKKIIFLLVVFLIAVPCLAQHQEARMIQGVMGAATTAVGPYKRAITIDHTKVPNVEGASSIWSKSLTSNSGNNGKWNIRIVLSSADISASASSIKLRVKSQPTYALTITGASIGERSGSTITFASAPTRVTFGGGNNSVTIPAGASVYSDWITFSLDHTKDYLVHLAFVTDAANYVPFVSGSGFEYLRQPNYSTDDTLTTTPTGYSSESNTACLADVRIPGTPTLTDFPFLFSGTYDYLADTNHGGKVTSIHGYDILFYSDSALTTQLDHEIESYDNASGAVNMWIRIPTLSQTADTTIYMKYGDSSITTSQEDIDGVWDANYKAVWHLKESGNPYADSTSNANSSNGGTYPAQATGQIGKGQSFTATSSQYIQFPSPFSTSQMTSTISGWIKDSSSSYNGVIYDDRYDSSRYGMALYIDKTTGYPTVYKATPATTLSISSDKRDGNWHYLCATYDGTTLVLYCDNLLPPASVVATWTSRNAVSSTVGRGYDPTYATAVIDEVRASIIARTEDWYDAEYNNQSSPSTFYSVGGVM
jgi:hypothetical protein